MSNRDSPGERQTERVTQFDYDEWVESVDGKEIVLDAPNGFPKIARCYYLPPWASVHSEFYCSECDCMRFPVFDDWGASRHCPVCGNEPGALELGTDGTFKDVEPNNV